MTKPRPAALLLILIATLTGGIPAQGLPAPDGPPPGGTDDPARAPLRSGRRALEAGRAADAARHFLHALELRPFDPTIIADLLAASGDSPSSRTLWAHAWWEAAADAAGKARPSRKVRALLPADDPWPEALARSRTEALAELEKFVAGLKGRGPRAAGDPLVAGWARRLAAELAWPQPSASKARAGTFARALERLQPDRRAVIDALESLLDRAIAREDDATTIHVARTLNALAAQAGFHDLQGPKAPDLEGVQRKARAALGRARGRLAGAPLRIEELLQMTLDEAEAFTATHAGWENPGRAFSPENRYLIETTCGYETLLQVASTIERHHRRLVNWYGTDPFLEQQGTARIVPEHWELESEGAPYWWAGGFQGGPITTVKFQCGNVEGLGHTLTHELTHRFDGRLLPGLPGWLSEGRAVWTGAAYGPSTATEFVPDFVSFGSVEAAFLKGYGGQANLEKLIEGTIEDYRDNYTAGYALWVYLSMWKEDGKLLFADRLQAYMKSLSSADRSNSLAWFTKAFADGQAGRPADFETFAQGFGEFVKGFYWQSPAPWTSMFKRRHPKYAGGDYVWDAPTWTMARSRAEPWLGQDHARIAMDLLVAGGDLDGAAAAGAWSLQVDEWDPVHTLTAARALADSRQADGAWVVRARVRERFPWALQEGPGPCPMLRSLPRLSAHLAAYGQAVASYQERGLDTVAAALQPDAARLSSLLGLAGPEAPPARPPSEDARHPFDRPALLLGALGWEEDGLTGYEERRVRDLWYETPEGDLHVGRNRPREGTDTMDRRAHQRHAFARSKLWMEPGRWRLSTRVHFTTSYVSGALIIGYTRRDRQVRMGFNAGDFNYAIGRSEEANKLEQVNCSLGGLRIRDGHLPGSLSHRTVKFADARESMRVEILVDGAMAQAWVEGELIGTYHTADGLPVEGYLGLAMGQGAVRMEAPRVQRLDRSGAWLDPTDTTGPWVLEAAASWPLRDWLNHTVVGAPRAPDGTLMVLAPAAEPDPEQPHAIEDAGWDAYDAAVRADKYVDEERLAQTIVVAVPANVPDAIIAEIEAALRETLVTDFVVVKHGLPPIPEVAGKSPVRNDRVQLLFLDSAGALRVVSTNMQDLDNPGHPIHRWTRVFSTPTP